MPLSLAAGNYRSALMDCAQALKYNPGQVKAIYRAGKACFELGKFTEVVRWCDQGLACDAGSTCLLELRSRAAKQQVLTPDVSEAPVERDVFTCSLLSRKCLKGTNAKRVRRPRRRRQRQRHFLQPSRCVFEYKTYWESVCMALIHGARVCKMCYLVVCAGSGCATCCQ